MYVKRSSANLVTRTDQLYRFLIVPLQIKSLKTCTTVNELRNATESLASGINDMYSSTREWTKAQSEKGREYVMYGVQPEANAI